MADTPAYYKPLVHSKKRRAAWHDYHSRCIYMITVSKAPGAPAFGHVTGIENPERAYIRLTSTGQIISEEIAAIPGHNPQLRVLKYVVMPDHFHALVFVTVPTSKSLGAIVQSLKAAATSRIRASLNAPALSVFEEGFHDRIITHRGQLDVVFNYIRENPRRLAVRRARPEFFRRVNELRIGEGTYRAYGNFQLLECPFKEQVVVHRADTPQERRLHRQQWLYTAANGGVLVSPFISPDERAIRNEAEELGGRFILLTNEPFPDRFKPCAHDFDLCEAGRLLLISLGVEEPQLSRQTCLAMNALAETVSQFTPKQPWIFCERS